jgi:tetratricopeptide (TPR) repeat protein
LVFGGSIGAWLVSILVKTKQKNKKNMETLRSVIKSVASDFKSDNENLDAYLELGTSYFAGNELKKALGHFENAIEEDPKNAGGWIGKAITHLAMTSVVEINTINIQDYIEKAILYTDESTIKKYLEAITLHYGFQFASAIKLYINQANQAIAEKKKAQVAAVVGLATAVAGGVVAKNSKSFTGSFIGYGMLAGGTGVTIKSGYDSFSLDQLSKSLYGNALAQAIISVSTMQSCYQIYEYSNGDLKQNVEFILDSWKDSVLFLFVNEKSNFLKLVNELSDTDKFLDKGKRLEVHNKIDEILYFMDMIGLDDSADFEHVKQLKAVVVSFAEQFSEEKIEAIENKRKKTQTGCCIASFIILFIVGSLGKRLPAESSIPGLFTIVGAVLIYRYYNKKREKINNETGMSEVHRNINQITIGFQKISIDKNAIDLKMLNT